MHYQNKKKQSPGEIRRKLGKAFDFTEGDLADNRAGFVSFRQKGVLREKLNWLLGFGFGALFFAALGVVGLWSTYEIISQGDLSSILMKLMAIVLTVVLGFINLCFFGFAYLMGWGAKEALTSLRNHQDDSRVNKIIVSKNPESRALESEDGRVFPISEDAYRALRRNGEYCLYYDDGIDGPIIYSIESLSELIADEEEEESAANFDEYKEKRHAKEKE